MARGEFNAEDMEKVDMMVRMIKELCTQEERTTEDVTRVLREAYEATDGNYGEKEAQEWGAADFIWPKI